MHIGNYNIDKLLNFLEKISWEDMSIIFNYGLKIKNHIFLLNLKDNL